jgi:pimeloyl-ACP methyl ester carboxylesterase
MTGVGMGIFVECWGDGARVVLVHGAMTTGAATWKRQRSLGERWKLVVPSRRGFVPNPPADESDYDVDAEDIAALLDDGAHLVGHSFGGLVALLAAARRPSAVHSLCLFEPATQALMRGDPEIEAGIAEHERRRLRFTDPREFLVDFMGALGAPDATVPDPLPDDMHQHAQLLLRERVPYEAQIPVATVASMPWPKLVVSGDHDRSQERVCDATARAIGAERARLGGAGHMIPRAVGCNELLEQFWARAT